MQIHAHKYQVAIVGGGPVGLLLGISLQRAGISCIILEQRPQARSGSRSLGIHPVSLELFDSLGIAEPFLERGIRISKGHALTNTSHLGTLSFEDCTEPYNFILSLPQHHTEALLEEELNKMNLQILHRGAKVTAFEEHDDDIKIQFQYKGEPKTLRASYLVGCDGKKSTIRTKADISFKGRRYSDTYIMGDFSDNTTLGSDAAIYLCDEGLIESFPLPGNNRRWVVKTDHYHSSVERSDIEQQVANRINHDLHDAGNKMLSSFGVQKLTAEPMVKKRIILIGDSAHVVSPIGGQGMNLGWLDACDLTSCIREIFHRDKAAEQTLHQFEKRRKKAVKNSSRRAELNMRLGRRATIPVLRNGIVSMMLKKPLSHFIARLFTMRGIENWVI